uniref:HAT C-terminal dimerisation domain-containing protein n=1 Tax=Lactuca sativa TaxID=4236 RepID=A0A9R1VX89_LACSA|nr:hypothetical protein LSAT_V11C400199540 [Lactuca sativa]
MLETAEKLQDIDINYSSYFYNEGDDDDSEKISTRKRKYSKKNDRVLGAPEDEDWEKARNFMDFLQNFYNVTKKVSGNKYVTSNLFVGELVTMHAAISNMCLNKDEKKNGMALSMKAKYDKYWDNLDNMNLLLHIALVLDPRNKMFFLDYCLGLIYGTNSEKRNEVNQRVLETLKELFIQYKKMTVKENEKNTIGSSTATTASFSSFVDLDLDDGYAKYLENRGKGINNTELDIYLADTTEKKMKGDNFDVLSWWNRNSGKYPILSKIAKDVLGMPISTVASESAFSTGGRVIDKFRSSLTPKTVEALICTQDWLRSTPSDLQETTIHGLQLQELMVNLEKLEIGNH